MVKIIIWQKKAILKVEQIATYLEEEYSEQSAEKFIKSVYATIEKIKTHPSRGRKVSSKKTIQFMNIGKFHQLFYRTKGTKLYILDLFDLRQNPDKRPFSN